MNNDFTTPERNNAQTPVNPPVPTPAAPPRAPMNTPGYYTAQPQMPPQYKATPTPPYMPPAQRPTAPAPVQRPYVQPTPPVAPPPYQAPVQSTPPVYKAPPVQYQPAPAYTVPTPPPVNPAPAQPVATDTEPEDVSPYTLPADEEVTCENITVNAEDNANNDIFNKTYSADSSTPSAAIPKKEKKGHKVFLIILFAIIGTFALGFFTLCGYILGQQDGETSLPSIFSQSDIFTDEDNAEEIEPDELYSDEGSVTLNPLPSDSSDTSKYTTQSAYEKVSKSTVGIVCYEKNSSVSSEPASQGTGIVITEDGYISTNSHVIGDSKTAYKIQVVTSDNKTHDATIVGFDTRTDLAVLKINAKNLTPAEFGNSELVKVGQDVLAIGNPGGIDFQNSLTRGVVSALDRELDLSTQVTYIQTDAAINPGNSGGPLCNIYGQVIGVNTAKISLDSYENMGFAIPSVTAKDIIDDLMKQGFVSDRVRIGITGIEISAATAETYNVPKGILIDSISEGGPCDNTKLQKNDIIYAIDGEEVASFKEVYQILGKHKPGDKVTLSVHRVETGEEYELRITLMADEGDTQN